MHQARISACGIAGWLIATMVATGCSESTAKPYANLSVAVVSAPVPRSTAAANGSPFWSGGFSVEVRAKNPSDLAAQISTCGGPEVEHESEPDVWTSAGAPMCALAGGAYEIDVPPRSERQWVQAVFPPSSAVKLSPGRVRLLFYYWTVGTSGEGDQTRSDPFELK